MRKLPPIFLLLIVLVIPVFCQQNPFPSNEEIAEARAGELILKSGIYLGHKADYGILVVPENRQIKDSRNIHIPIIRILSSSKKPGTPVFYFTGGPGEANVLTEDAAVKQWKNGIPCPWLLEQHDMVLVGFRGVDGPVKLVSPKFFTTMRHTRAPLSVPSLKTLGTALKTDFRKMRKSGIEVDSYNVVEVADDIDAARKGLEFEEINLLSYSYGTQVAYTYCLRHPRQVKRNVMISGDSPGHMTVWEPAVVDAQLRHYAQLWEKDSQCVKRSPDLIKTIRNVISDLDSGKFPKNLDIDPDKVKIMTYFFLSNTASAVHMLDAFVSAEEGNFHKIQLLTYAFQTGVPTHVKWGDFYTKLISLGDVDRSRNYSEGMNPEQSVMGSPATKFIMGVAQYAGWPVKPIDKIFRQNQYIDSQTLLLCGNLDFKGPVQNVKKTLLPYLRNGKLIILKEMGHRDVIEFQQESLRHLVETFFSKGIVDKSKYKYHPVNFHPQESFLDWLWSQAN